VAAATYAAATDIGGRGSVRRLRRRRPDRSLHAASSSRSELRSAVGRV